VCTPCVFVVRPSNVGQTHHYTHLLLLFLLISTYLFFVQRADRLSPDRAGDGTAVAGRDPQLRLLAVSAYTPSPSFDDTCAVLVAPIPYSCSLTTCTSLPVYIAAHIADRSASRATLTLVSWRPRPPSRSFQAPRSQTVFVLRIRGHLRTPIKRSRPQNPTEITGAADNEGSALDSKAACLQREASSFALVASEAMD